MEKNYDLLIVKGRIGESVLKNIEKQINGHTNDILYLLLDTPGGDGNIGFRAMNLLNVSYKKIFILVPNRAMSTGTLMALGGNKIYMKSSSCLGPLDLQIEHPNDGSWISTLDVRDTMRTLISHTELAAKRLYTQIYTEFSLGKNEAARIANDAAVKLINPIVDKIDPYHLHKSFRGAEVGATYGATLLKTRMMSGAPKLADLVASYLANNYDAHNYSITPTEAKEVLSLAIDDLEKLGVWPSIRSAYEKAGDGVKYISKEPEPAASPASQVTKQKTTKKEEAK